MNNMLFICLILLIFNFLIFIFLIPYLKKIKFGQSIRKEGPKTHYSKSGTPTMGGIGIIIGTLINFIVLIGYFHKRELIIFNKYEIREILILILPFILYGIIGFIDDYLIVIKHNNQGLSAKMKFILQLIIGTIVYIIYLDLGFDNYINFFGVKVDLLFGYGVLVVLLYVGFSNATNLTDGLDGLLAGCSIIVFITYLIISLLFENYLIFIFSLSFICILVSYLFFNLPKACVFMGDVGSLSIGAAIVSVSILLKIEVMLLLLGFVFVIETLSVILQVWFFKKTKGSRLFKMTPLHHHFEINGFNDWEINLIFWMIEIVSCLIGGGIICKMW